MRQERGQAFATGIGDSEGGFEEINAVCGMAAQVGARRGAVQYLVPGGSEWSNSSHAARCPSRRASSLATTLPLMLSEETPD